MKVTFIGLGIMGSRMAERLVSPEISLTVFNRDSQKADKLWSLGATVSNNLSQAVKEAEVVFTMLSTPKVVAELAAGESGFLKSMKKDSLWVDCSTVSPTNVGHFLGIAKKAGVNYFEAPVAGTKQPAENGELVFFAGGEESQYQRISFLLDRMGKKTIFMGEHGRAASMKLVINLMLAQSMYAFSEAVKLGGALDLEMELVQDILLSTPVTAPFLNIIKEKIRARDESPNFPLQWMSKDLQLVMDSIRNLNMSLPASEVIAISYEMAVEAGLANEDFSSIYHFINK